MALSMSVLRSCAVGYTWQIVSIFEEFNSRYLLNSGIWLLTAKKVLIPARSASSRVSKTFRSVL